MADDGAILIGNGGSAAANGNRVVISGSPNLSGAYLAGGTSKRGTHHWECGFQAAVRDGDLKLRIVHGDDPQAEGIRRIEHAEPGGGVTLHDVRRDVAEAHDLAAERPDDVARLWALHEAWLADVGRPDLAVRHQRAVRALLAGGPSRQ